MTYFTGKLVRVFLISVLSAMLLSGFAMAAESEQAIAVGCTTGTSLRVRNEPSTNADIVTMLHDKYTAVAILDHSQEGWMKIAYNGVTGYISSDYMMIDQDNVFETYGRVSGDAVNVRADASTNTEIVASVGMGTSVTVTGFVNGWYSVTLSDGTVGYIRSDFLSLTETEPAAPGSGNAGLANTAMQYLGVPYVWGGESPRGFDCSGFTLYIAKQYGYSLPHSASAQWQSGAGAKVYSVSELQPGDLVFFCDPSRSNGKACSHAGIYIGGGKHVHASSSKSGVVTSDLTSGYYNRYFVGGIRLA